MADDDQVEPSPEIHFEPIVSLPVVEPKALEEDEDVLFQMRAKLYRYDNNDENPEWKERGTGDIKILKHNITNDVRIVMRRDKTFKLCANHTIQPYMTLKPNSTSDRAWIWSTYADFSDGDAKPELLAVKFQNAENAQKFKAAFEKAKVISTTKSLDDSSDINNSSLLTSGDDSESDINGTTDTSKCDTDTSKCEDSSKIEEAGDSLKVTKEKEDSEVVGKLENLSLKNGNDVKEENIDKKVEANGTEKS